MQDIGAEASLLSGFMEAPLLAIVNRVLQRISLELINPFSCMGACMCGRYTNEQTFQFI